MAKSSPISINEQILQKFSELIQTFGIKQITVDMIAERCGISKKTVYKYFESKNDIVATIIGDILDKLGDSFEEIDRSAEKPLVKLDSIFNSMYELLGSLSTPLLHDIKTSYPEINSRIDRFRNSHWELVKRTIASGIESEDFSPDIDPDIAVEMVMGAAEKVFTPDYILGHNHTIEKTLTSFKAIIVHGLVKK